MKILICLALAMCGMLIPQDAAAQTIGYEMDSLQIWYSPNYDLLIRKFEREHMPLNGEEVPLIPFRESEFYGFVKPGQPDKYKIKPQFEQVFALYPEGAIVKDTAALYGVINTKGKYMVPPHYSNLFKHQGGFLGMSTVTGDSTYALPEQYRSFIWVDYYSSSGKLLFNEKCHDFSPFIGNDQLTWFRYGREIHIRNTAGELLKSFQLNEEKIFEGVADDLLIFSEVINKKRYYVAYDTEGKQKFKLPSRGWNAERVHRLTPNMYGMVSPDADYYFCDSTGKDYPFSVISPYVGMISPDLSYFDQKEFQVADRNRGTRGVVSAKGDTLIPFVYRVLDLPVDGWRFAMDENKNAKFIDEKGEQVLGVELWIEKLLDHRTTAMEEPIGFYDGLCLGIDFLLMEDSVDGELQQFIDPDSTIYFYFDKQGQRQLELPASVVFAGNFSEGLAPVVNKHGALGFVNKAGEWAIKPDYEIALAGAYPFPYVVVPKFIGGYAYIKAFKGYIDKNGVPYFSGKRMQDHYDFSH